MSEGSDKENKRLADKTLQQTPKRSKSFTSSLAQLNVDEESEEENFNESTQKDKKTDMALFGDQNTDLNVAGAT